MSPGYTNFFYWRPSRSDPALGGTNGHFDPRSLVMVSGCPAKVRVSTKRSPDPLVVPVDRRPRAPEGARAMEERRRTTGRADVLFDVGAPKILSFLDSRLAAIRSEAGVEIGEASTMELNRRVTGGRTTNDSTWDSNVTATWNTIRIMF